jgi:hypothetical protein
MALSVFLEEFLPTTDTAPGYLEGTGNLRTCGHTVYQQLADDMFKTLAVVFPVTVKRKTALKIINDTVSLLNANMKADDYHVFRK